MQNRFWKRNSNWIRIDFSESALSLSGAVLASLSIHAPNSAKCRKLSAVGSCCVL